jgi:hypothetical protein
MYSSVTCSHVMYYIAPIPNPLLLYSASEFLNIW